MPFNPEVKPAILAVAAIVWSSACNTSFAAWASSKALVSPLQRRPLLEQLRFQTQAASASAFIALSAMFCVISRAELIMAPRSPRSTTVAEVLS